MLLMMMVSLNLVPNFTAQGAAPKANISEIKAQADAAKAQANELEAQANKPKTKAPKPHGAGQALDLQA
jgi:hypothetical protein